MNDELFSQLLARVSEGAAILQGQRVASRIFTIQEPDVKQIRAHLKLSQAQFASLLGVSVKTLRNWELGRKTPQGPARVLLQVAANYPEALLDSHRSDLEINSSND